MAGRGTDAVLSTETGGKRTGDLTHAKTLHAPMDMGDAGPCAGCRFLTMRIAWPASSRCSVRRCVGLGQEFRAVTIPGQHPGARGLRAGHCSRAETRHVCVDPGGAGVLAPRPFPNRADGLACLEQVQRLEVPRHRSRPQGRPGRRTRTWARSQRPSTAAAPRPGTCVRVDPGGAGALRQGQSVTVRMAWPASSRCSVRRCRHRSRPQGRSGRRTRTWGPQPAAVHCSRAETRRARVWIQAVPGALRPTTPAPCREVPARLDQPRRERAPCGARDGARRRDDTPPSRARGPEPSTAARPGAGTPV